MENNKTWLKVLIGILVVIWSFVTLNKGFYMDENGLLTLYKSIYSGQHMFVDSWDELQTGAVIVWPLMALYYQVLAAPLAGLGIGLVLYIRICYMIIHLLVCCYVYYTLRCSDFEEGAFSATMLYFMFVIGWRGLSYKTFSDLSIMLTICFLFRFHETRQLRFAVFGAIAVCVGILSYPTMIVMPFVIGFMMIWAIRHNYLSVNVLTAFVVTCVICGGLFLLYLGLTTGISQAIAMLPNFGDNDYEESILMRVVRLLAYYAGMAVISYIPILFILLIKKLRYMSERTEHVILTVYWLVFLVAICALRYESISISRFVYGIIILFFWFPYFMYEERENEYTTIGTYGIKDDNSRRLLWLVFGLSIAAQFTWMLATNQGVDITGHMAIYVVMLEIILFAREKQGLMGLAHIVLACALFFMGFWLPESNGGYNDILEARSLVTEGAYEGMELDTYDYERNQAVLQLTDNYISPEDYVLVCFGTKSTGYLNMNAHFGTYGAYARCHVNRKLLDYWELNPGNQATCVILDTADPNYEKFLAGECGQYIMDTYTEEAATSGSFILLRMEDSLEGSEGN